MRVSTLVLSLIEVKQHFFPFQVWTASLWQWEENTCFITVMVGLGFWNLWITEYPLVIVSSFNAIFWLGNGPRVSQRWKLFGKFHLCLQENSLNKMVLPVVIAENRQRYFLFFQQPKKSGKKRKKTITIFLQCKTKDPKMPRNLACSALCSCAQCVKLLSDTLLSPLQTFYC